METKVYAIRDSEMIDAILNDDIDSFRELIENDYTLDCPCETFKNEQEADAFCSGIGYGSDERGCIEVFALRSNEETDIPFIEVIETFM